MKKNIILISILFASFFNATAQEKKERTTDKSFGITFEHSFQKMNTLSIGGNYCIGLTKGKSMRTSYFQVDALYAGVYEDISSTHDINYYSGFKTGINYNYVGRDAFGISTGVNYLYFNDNNLVSPEVGINFLGVFSISYGYSLDVAKNVKDNYSRIGIKISLNRVYALAIRMV